MSELVTTDIDDSIAVVTMDDGKVNALSLDMQAQLGAALDSIEARDDVACVVLAGRPGVFSAGFDLSVMAAGDMAAIVDMVASGGELVRRLYGFPLPVVAAATGHAIAGGAFTLMGCDVRIGTDPSEGEPGASRYGMNEVAIGMAVPEWAITISSHRLSNRHLNRALLTARLTDGPGALDVGFLDAVVAPDAVVDEAMAEARSLVGLDRRSYVEMISRYRGAVLEEMAAEIATDRAAVS